MRRNTDTGLWTTRVTPPRHVPDDPRTTPGQPLFEGRADVVRHRERPGPSPGAGGGPCRDSRHIDTMAVVKLT
ncbi:hypothetical protein [Streptomyces sp. NPDC052036]|uniref:hypothetical protein n=1 Tax=Streptomyces sp. NPDC052036 TaxID=3155171 RepID=UPI003435AAFC